MLIARNAAFSLYLVEDEQARPEAMGQPTYRNKKAHTLGTFKISASSFACYPYLLFYNVYLLLYFTIYYAFSFFTLFSMTSLRFRISL